MSPGSPDHDWKTFFDAVEGLPPRDTLLKAAGMFEREGRLEGAAGGMLAVDLGCGQGRDTIELLKRGWSVLAVDTAADGLSRLVRATPWGALWRLTTRRSSFEEVAVPPCELVNASFAIPHCAPSDFPGIWAKIAGAVRPGGRFAGQLFGVNDGWAKRPDGVTRTYHSRAEVESLLADHGLEAEQLEEVERDGKTAMGEPKYWHVFHIVARKG